MEWQVFRSCLFKIWFTQLCLKSPNVTVCLLPQSKRTCSRVFFSFWFSGFGFWFAVFGFWFAVFSFWFSVSDSRSFVSDSRILVSDSRDFWFLIRGILVSDSRILVSDSRLLVSDSLFLIRGKFLIRGLFWPSRPFAFKGTHDPVLVSFHGHTALQNFPACLKMGYPSPCFRWTKMHVVGPLGLVVNLTGGPDRSSIVFFSHVVPTTQQ